MNTLSRYGLIDHGNAGGTFAAIQRSTGLRFGLHQDEKTLLLFGQTGRRLLERWSAGFGDLGKG